jgi:predicted DNA-binding ribbon-helix-helix protein
LARAEAGDTVKKQKRSVTLSGHRTSVSLEDEFWTALQEIAASSGQNLAALIDENLSSALRLFVLHHYRNTGN